MSRAVALFSGGLDSLLAAKIVAAQGIDVRCLHFVSPFFGNRSRIRHWEEEYGLRIEAVDVSEEMTALIRTLPPHGFGKVMNPCVDCKILMMRRAVSIMHDIEADFIISGEVLGQRPMSQRRDTLNVIRRDADVQDILLRPLCAQHLDPTEPERMGIVDRSRLYGISGRSRSEQLRLAHEMGIREIPSPAGGCLLTERENAARYYAVFSGLEHAGADDMRLAGVGRQAWSGKYWLSVGRNAEDNSMLEQLALPRDVLMRVNGFPSPLALGRSDLEWGESILRDAASWMASFSPKAVQSGGSVNVLVTSDGRTEMLNVLPSRITPAHWTSPSFEVMKSALKEAAREREARIVRERICRMQDNRENADLDNI
ncbi:MAG: tRNA(5-methylaminomethyl-2-thiouridylate) methyltransferase [Desulfovibrionaceae bacterium]|nr:tRNA(5-methylaminomethyl-2-thiouridylate) methyltransferase [Desulfovibrionaceae bacterium]